MKKIVIIFVVILLAIALSFAIILNNNKNNNPNSTENNSNIYNINSENISSISEDQELKDIKILGTKNYEMYIYESVIENDGPNYENPKKIENLSDINKIIDVLNTAVKYTPKDPFGYSPTNMLKIKTDDEEYEIYEVGNTFNSENEKNLIVFESSNTKTIYQIDGTLDLSNFYNIY